MVEFTDRKHADLPDYRLLRRPTIRGTLGLINVGADVFICVITSASEVANVRPGERVLRIAAVDFCTTWTDSRLFIAPGADAS